MEKWDSYGHESTRHYFVLPRSILEQELASVKSVCLEKETRNGLSHSTRRPHNSTSNRNERESTEKLDLDQVLREARSRLAEDIADSLSNSDNGDVLLPHLLDKYKEVKCFLYVNSIW
jgi:hypothetical protein